MLGARVSVISCWMGLATIGLMCLAGCDSTARREQLVSPYPLDRARAAVGLAEAGDGQAVDLLIELLSDHDRAVRMYTILALERLCGETHGYHYYDPEPERAAAIARWRTARQDGEVTLRKRPRPAQPDEARSSGTGEESAATAAGFDQREERSP